MLKMLNNIRKNRWVRGAVAGSFLVVGGGTLAGCSGHTGGPVPSVNINAQPLPQQQLGTQQVGGQLAEIAPATNYSRVRERPAGPIVRQWGSEAFLNGSISGCYGHQYWAYPNEQGQIVYYRKVVQRYTNIQSPALCNTLTGAAGVGELRFNPFQPRYRY